LGKFFGELATAGRRDLEGGEDRLAVLDAEEGGPGELVDDVKDEHDRQADLDCTLIPLGRFLHPDPPLPLPEELAVRRREVHVDLQGHHLDGRVKGWSDEEQYLPRWRG
jgi:hypothetical protein